MLRSDKGILLLLATKTIDGWVAPLSTAFLLFEASLSCHTGKKRWNWVTKSTLVPDPLFALINVSAKKFHKAQRVDTALFV